MEQKIKVEVATAAQDQWPRVGSVSKSPPNGSKYYAIFTNGSICVWQMDASGNDKEIGHQDCEDKLFDGIVFFNSWESLVKWLNNPQPVTTEPEKVELWKMPPYSFFVHKGEVYRDTVDVSSGNGFRSVYHQKSGKTVLLSSDTLVTPFKGRITIDVE